jgi:aspartate racemase
MHIGLIGGIGPAGTISYYRRLMAAAAGQPLELTIVQADVMTLAANAEADQRHEQARVYADLIQRLKNAGADVAAITSVGGHFCYAELLPISPLPLCSGIDPLDLHFAAQGIETIGILGTTTVMQSRVYGQLHKTRSVVPPEAVLPDIGAAYVGMAKSGICDDALRQTFFEAGRQMMDQGADAILLGGTDLGLAFDDHDPGFPVIDAAQVHVNALFALTQTKD